MTTITIDPPYNFRWEKFSVLNIPHICEGAEFPKMDYRDPFHLNRCSIHVTLRYSQDWEIHEHGTDMSVRIFEGRCPECGQDYQAWTWRYWSGDEVGMFYRV